MIEPGPDARNIDPTTRALEAYIDASVEQLLQGNKATPQNSLLFLSAWHEAMPALVHLDPVLDPVVPGCSRFSGSGPSSRGEAPPLFPHTIICSSGRISIPARPWPVHWPSCASPAG